jgi:hypothetical protein
MENGKGKTNKRLMPIRRDIHYEGLSEVGALLGDIWQHGTSTFWGRIIEI